MSVLQLFFAILIVIFISIILMIANVLFQLRIGSRISLLKHDLEKTNLEFSLLRKERGVLQQAPKPPIDISPLLDMPHSQQTVIEGGIQIVRNVRGTFTATETHYPDPTGPDDGSVSGAEESPRTAERRQTGYNSGSETGEPKQMRIAHTGPSAAPSSYIQSAGYRPDDPAVVIPLFSPAAEGPDLNALYFSLMDLLATRPDRTIAFDFAGIQFLHTQELEYLEEIYRALLHQQRTLIFVNCGGQVSALLQRHPNLAALIR